LGDLVENSGGFASDVVLCSRDRRMSRMSTTMEEKACLSVTDVARTLSLGVTYTRRLINRGDIKSVRVGKRVLVPRQYLDEYLSKLIRSTQSA